MTNSVDETGVTDAVEDPAAAIRQIREQQCRRCAEEIDAVLQKYSCRIVPVITLHGAQIESSVSITPVN